MIFRGKDVETSHPAYFAKCVFWKPVCERHDGMELNWEPSIWCGDENSLSRDAQGFTKKCSLFFSTAHVLQDSTGVHIVKFPVCEWKIAPISPNEFQACIHFFKKCCVIQAARCNALLVRIPELEVI